MKPFTYKPPKGPIEVLFCDADLCVVNKPAGLLSVPGRDPAHHDSLASRLQADMPEITVVHRLDMDTSGVMVFARSAQAHRHLSKQFETKRIEKLYLCLVEGVVEDDEGEIDLPLRCDWPNRPLQMVDHEQGKKAVTHWRVHTRLEDRTLLELRPLTGRSHQLRVHCLSMGHPILGDRFYAPDHVIEKSKRLCLHAQNLTFTHPVSEEKMSFRVEADFD